MTTSIYDRLQDNLEGVVGYTDCGGRIGRMASNASFRALTEDIEIRHPHREECGGGWQPHPVGSNLYRFTCAYDPAGCPAEARIPTFLLRELVAFRSREAAR